MVIGVNVKKYRELKDYSLSDLAEKAGVSKAFLWEIEQGNSKRPGAEVLFKIATALDVTVAELMGKKLPKVKSPEIQPEINKGLKEFIEERKRQGNPLDQEEIMSLAYVQLRGGRPQTKDDWAFVYAALKRSTDQRGRADG